MYVVKEPIASSLGTGRERAWWFDSAKRNLCRLCVGQERGDLLEDESESVKGLNLEKWNATLRVC